jgi:hypothetical protein
VIAGRGLTFFARERVFLFCVRVQEHREVLADAPVSLRFEFLGTRAYDAPVPLPVRDAELCVTDCATYEIDLHRVIVPECCVLS